MDEEQQGNHLSDTQEEPKGMRSPDTRGETEIGRQRPLGADPELQAMSEARRTLDGLKDDAARQRVVDWLFQRYGGKHAMRRAPRDNDIQEHTPAEAHAGINSLGSLAEVFSKACPRTEHEKVLVAGAYLQERDSKQELRAREINQELKHLGHGVKNVTSAISVVINRKPSLMIQKRKQGRSKQAKKKYMVTQEGLKAVREMLKTASGAEE